MKVCELETFSFFALNFNQLLILLSCTVLDLILREGTRIIVHIWNISWFVFAKYIAKTLLVSNLIEKNKLGGLSGVKITDRNFASLAIDISAIKLASVYPQPFIFG